MRSWSLTREAMDSMDPRRLLLVVFDVNGALRFIRGEALANVEDLEVQGAQLTDLVAGAVEGFNRRGASVNLFAADAKGQMYPIELQGLFTAGEMEMISNEAPMMDLEEGNVIDIPDLDTVSRMVCAHLDVLGADGFHLQFNRSTRCYALALDTPTPL